MSRMAVLDAVAHHDLRVTIGHGAAFGDAVNEVPVFSTEIAEAQRDYPIVLRTDPDGRLRLVALLGFDRDENLFLEGGQGREQWQDRHIPLVLQRGPFLIGRPADRHANKGADQSVDRDRERGGDRGNEGPREGEASGGQPPILLVDLDHPRIADAQGEPVFLPHGGHSPYLLHVIGVLRRIHEGTEATPSMINSFVRAGLVEPLTLQVSLDATLRYDIPDCHVVSPALLAGATGETLASLNRAGSLASAFLIAHSLANVGKLIARKNRKRLASSRARAA